MSLSPKDLDFIEAKNAAAREIALALGVPPMLLGIPGDNTYSNMQEATRMFWRQTVLPIVARTAKALSGWLAPAYGSPIELRADLDGIEALSTEREALWARIDKATFLTPNEKRAAAGYGPVTSGDEFKFNPDQFRVPAGQPGGGQWTDGGGGEDAESNPRDARVISIARRRGGIPKELWNLTVRQFVSKYCKGATNRELPGEFEDVTLADIIDLANGGDAAAKKCKKILEQPRFRK